MFVAKAVIVRNLENCRIVFKDKETIAVTVGDGVVHYFHRWFREERGNYINGWRDFRRKMLRNKKLTLMACIFYASKYNVDCHSSTRPLSLEGKKIIERN